MLTPLASAEGTNGRREVARSCWNGSAGGQRKRDVVSGLGLAENMSLHLARSESIQSPCDEAARCFYCNVHVAAPSAPFGFQVRRMSEGARISQLFF